jgi:hypothetical protein
MTIRVRLALRILLAAGLSVSASAQTLGDAARRAEEEKSRTKQPAKVFTNDDVRDAPPAPSPGPSSTGSSADTRSAEPVPAGRRDERPREVAADLSPVPASEGRIQVRTVGGPRGNATQTELTLPFRAGQQNAPVTLALSALHEDRLPFVDTPIELEARFLAESLFLGKVSFERPHLVIAVGDPPGQPVIVGSVDERADMGFVADISMAIDLATLSTLEGASRIVGRLFGAEFALSPGQVRLVSDFSRRARRNPGRGPQ